MLEIFASLTRVEQRKFLGWFVQLRRLVDGVVPRDSSSDDGDDDSGDGSGNDDARSGGDDDREDDDGEDGDDHNNSSDDSDDDDDAHQEPGDDDDGEDGRDEEERHLLKAAVEVEVKVGVPSAEEGDGGGLVMQWNGREEAGAGAHPGISSAAAVTERRSPAPAFRFDLSDPERKVPSTLGAANASSSSGSAQPHSFGKPAGGLGSAEAEPSSSRGKPAIEDGGSVGKPVFAFAGSTAISAGGSTGTFVFGKVGEVQGVTAPAPSPAAEVKPEHQAGGGERQEGKGAEMGGAG